MNDTERPPSSRSRALFRYVLADVCTLHPAELADVHADARSLRGAPDVRPLLAELERLAPEYRARAVPLLVVRLAFVSTSRPDLDRALLDAEAAGLLRLVPADPAHVYEPAAGIPDSARGVLYFVATPERLPMPPGIQDVIAALGALSPEQLEEAHAFVRVLRQAHASDVDPVLARQIATAVRERRGAYAFAPAVPLSALRLAFPQPRAIFDRSLVHAERKGMVRLYPLDPFAPFVQLSAALRDRDRGPLYYVGTGDAQLSAGPARRAEGARPVA